MKLPAAWSDLEVIDLIGSGSYGSVYEVEDPDTKETYAVKCIQIPSDQSEAETIKKTYGETAQEYCAGIARELDNEITLMNDLNKTKNVVHIIDHITDKQTDDIGWNIFIKMELLNEISEICFDESMVIRLGLDICSALEECEKRGIVHRDLKPDNILVDKNGSFKLSDFGVAKKIDKTGTHSVKGTFTYMAPELFSGSSYGSQVDIYSLGIIMYQLMNHNREPFIDLEKRMIYFKDREDALTRRMNGEVMPPPVDASDALAEIILKACAFATDKRYKNASEMKADLWSLKLGTYKVKNAHSSRKKDISFEKKTTIRKTVLLTIILAAIAVAAIFAGSYAVREFSYEQIDNVSWINGNGTLKTNGSEPVGTIFYDRTIPEIRKVIFTEDFTDLPDNMFSKCSFLEEVTLPDTLETIGSNAFKNCSSLKQIDIPDSLRTIGDYAFEGCTSLKEISLPDSMSYIGDYAFKDCTALETVYMPFTVIVDVENCFENCGSIQIINS